MNHAEFVEGYRAGKLALHVDKDAANRLSANGAIDRANQASNSFWSWVALALIFGAIPIWIWVSFWWALGSFLLGAGTSSAIRHTAAQGIQDRVLEEPAYYEKMMRAGVIRVSERAE